MTPMMLLNQNKVSWIFKYDANLIILADIRFDDEYECNLLSTMEYKR